MDVPTHFDCSGTPPSTMVCENSVKKIHEDNIAKMDGRALADIYYGTLGKEIGVLIDKFSSCDANEKPSNGNIASCVIVLDDNNFKNRFGFLPSDLPHNSPITVVTYSTYLTEVLKVLLKMSTNKTSAGIPAALAAFYDVVVTLDGSVD